MALCLYKFYSLILLDKSAAFFDRDVVRVDLGILEHHKDTMVDDI